MWTEEDVELYDRYSNEYANPIIIERLPDELKQGLSSNKLYLDISSIKKDLKSGYYYWYWNVRENNEDDKSVMFGNTKTLGFPAWHRQEVIREKREQLIDELLKNRPDLPI